MQESLLSKLSQDLLDEAELRGTDELFGDYIRRTAPQYVFYDHVRVLIDALQALADREIRNLLVQMPPRHGKSETVSRSFPAYHLARFPEWWVSLVSYGSNLSEGLSRDARERFISGGGVLSGDASAVKLWKTTQGGGFWCAGVGGALTGKGFHCGIIDDPIKNAEQAQSETFLDKQWEWYKSTYYNRAEPDAIKLHVQTRWSQFDLAGRILDGIKEGTVDEDWTIINFEAIKTSRSFNFPKRCTVIEDNREVGEALCPERYDINDLTKIKAASDSFWWSCLYQQSPSPETGEFWKREWFRTYRDLPRKENGNLAVHSMGYDWDTAYTKDDKNAATAYVLSYRDDNHNIYIDQVGCRWLQTPDVIRWMKSLGGPHYIEEKASGRSIKDTLLENGIDAIPVTVTSDKIARTRSAMPTVESGRVFVREAILPILLDDERQGILKFPNSAWKDLNDAFTQAIQRHKIPKSSGAGDTWRY